MILGTLIETRALVLRRQGEGKPPRTNGAANGAAHGSTLATGGYPGTDAELIEAARKAKNGEKFSRLFDAANTPADSKSRSEADAALIGVLGFWCGPNPERIDRLARQSERWRERWDEDRSTDAGIVTWLRRSIDQWLETNPTFYQSRDAEKPAVQFLAGPDRAILTEAEIAGVPTEPPVIVAGYLPEDCGSQSAQGGTGKTTLDLYETVHIILGTSLWGREVVKPGNVLFVTAEDSRGQTSYRLNCICTAMGLSAAERDRVRLGFFCEDLSDKPGARLLAMVKGEVTVTTLPAEIIERYHNRNVSYVHLDPTSLLGPGEASGNEGMTELMRVGRMMSRGLLAGVRNIHHVSQHVARAGIQDQYAGRGGTAFADNGRFSHQLVTVTKRKYTFNGVNYLLPAEATDEAMRRGHVLAILIHKVSYMERPSDPIFIRREGFHYEQLQANVVGEAPGAVDVDADAKTVQKVVDYLNQKLADGLHYSTSKFSDDHCKPLGLQRVDLRRILDEGLQTGIFEEVPLPKNECKGQRKIFIRAKAGLYE
jgi:RecA-family ATPase